MTGKAIGMRIKRWSRYIRVISCGMIFGLIAPGFCAASGSAAPMQLNYQVTHSTYGNIGTYSNAIEPGAGGATTVQTQAHFAVKVLGVTLHREDAQRTERWQGNRLMSFSGVTNKGGEPVVVRGEARGNNFVINSPQGTVTAPATVHPANPWSANFLSSNTMMRPDSGKLERVRVSGGEEVMVEIDGRSVRARRYEITGDGRYAVWINDRGVPVQFAADDDSGKVTFTLASCSGCGVIPAMQQMGMK
jgi:Family of unknown function (DUF6134)